MPAMSVRGKLVPTVHVGVHRGVAIPFFLCITLGAGVAVCFGGIRLGGRPLTGYVWTLQLAITLFVILTHRKKSHAYPLRFWAPWIAWMVVRCDWGDFAAAQRVIMLAGCPLVAVAAERAVRTKEQLESLLHSLGPLLLITGPLVIFDTQRVLPFEIQSVPCGAMMFFCLGACYASAHAYRSPHEGLLMWAYCAACCALLSSRMATLVTILTLPTSPMPHTRRLRCIALFATIAIGIAALALPGMRLKNFRDADVTIPDMWDQRETFSTSGRQTMWQFYWDEAVKTPIFGAGANADVQLGIDHEVGGVAWAHPHNEYLRVFLNFGLLGVILVGIPIAQCTLHACLCMRWTSDVTLRVAWGTVVSGMIAMCLLAISGNVLLYIVFFGFPLFSIMGAAHGLAEAAKLPT